MLKCISNIKSNGIVINFTVSNLIHHLKVQFRSVDIDDTGF